MLNEPTDDPWNPETYPWEIAEGLPLAMGALEKGHKRQWRLLAEQYVAVGTVERAPHPELRTVDTRTLRPFLEGVQQARRDAAEMVAAGVFDGAEILRESDAEDERRRWVVEENDRFIGPGTFQRPVDWDTARLHTTVTRLFTDPVVHDIVGTPHHPVVTHSTMAAFAGPVKLLGRGEFDLGVSLDGEYEVVLINASPDEPGSGVGALRLLWGPPDAIVGAIDCGELHGYRTWAGLGPAGAAKEFRSDDALVGIRGRLSTVETASGTSHWFSSNAAMGDFRVLIAVDVARKPVGVILDSSYITNYYWFDADDEDVHSEWPADAREFDPTTDTEGENPNVGDNGEGVG